MVNWTMLPHMSEIWREDDRTRSSPTAAGRRRTFFVDLADPEKRTPEDIREASACSPGSRNRWTSILGLNLKESGWRSSDVLGLPGAGRLPRP